MKRRTESQKLAHIANLLNLACRNAGEITGYNTTRKYLAAMFVGQSIEAAYGLRDDAQRRRALALTCAAENFVMKAMECK
jgi:hypothetical protein